MFELGEKLPIMFILKARPGGTIEEHELLTYPGPHTYIVQSNAWMDDRGWTIYIRKVLM